MWFAIIGVIVMLIGTIVSYYNQVQAHKRATPSAPAAPGRRRSVPEQRLAVRCARAAAAVVDRHEQLAVRRAQPAGPGAARQRLPHRCMSRSCSPADANHAARAGRSCNADCADQRSIRMRSGTP